MTFAVFLPEEALLEPVPVLWFLSTSGPPRRLPLYGPPGLRDYWQNFLKAMNFDHNTRIVDDKRMDHPLAISPSAQQFSQQRHHE